MSINYLTNYCFDEYKDINLAATNLIISSLISETYIDS